MTIEDIIKKWKNRADNISMCDTDDPYFAKKEIRDLLKDLEEHEKENPESI